MNLWLLITVLSLLFGLIGLFFVLKKLYPKTAWYRVMEIFFTGLFACGVALLLGEMGLLSGHFHEHIKRDIIEIASEEVSIGRGISLDKKKENKTIIKESPYSSSNDKALSPVSDLVDSIITPMLEQPVRYNLEITYDQTIDNLHGKKIMRVKQGSTWVYKNPSGIPMIFPQHIESTMEPIQGIKPEDLFKITEFKVNGKPRSRAMKMEKLEDGRYRFSGTTDLQIKDILIIELEIERINPYQDYLTLWMNVPTKDLKLIYKHPKNLIPRFYVFGFGKIVEEKGISDLNVWRYDGWLLRKQGIILFWTEK